MSKNQRKVSRLFDGISPSQAAEKKRKAVISALISNVMTQNFQPSSDDVVFQTVNGARQSLPAYVPCIGRRFFDFRPRILCFAINQNLSIHRKWTQKWLSEWFSNYDVAVNRLNFAYENGNPIPIRPYAEGFIPLVAMILIASLQPKYGNPLPTKVDDVIAVTNFVKFSTSSDASSSSIPPLWWRECGMRFVSKEISLLNPDFIVCFGQKTYLETKRVIEEMQPNLAPRIVYYRFPARIPSNNSRPLTSSEQNLWSKIIHPLTAKITKSPKSHFHKWRADQFCAYFFEAITLANSHSA